jgi:hypothetical protein
MRDEKENSMERLEPISPSTPTGQGWTRQMQRRSVSLVEVDEMEIPSISRACAKVALRGCPLLNRRLAARTKYCFLGFLGFLGYGVCFGQRVDIAGVREEDGTPPPPMRDESEDGDIRPVPNAISPSGDGGGRASHWQRRRRTQRRRRATNCSTVKSSENRAHVAYVDARLQVGRLAPVVRTPGRAWGGIDKACPYC